MLTAMLVLAVTLAAQPSAAPAESDAYVGRRNVKIADAADTFASDGFQIESKAGATSAGIVWRWGSKTAAHLPRCWRFRGASSAWSFAQSVVSGSRRNA